MQLDTVSLMVFVAIFAASAITAMRRPMYAASFLLAVAPLELARTVAGTDITLEKAALAGVLVGLSTFAGSARLLNGRDIRPVLALALAVAAVSALSVAAAVYRWPVARETLKALEHAVLIATAYVCYRLDPAETLPVRVFAIAGLLVIAAALVQDAFAPSSIVVVNGRTIPRLSGILQGPNQLAGYCEVLSAVGAAAYARLRAGWVLALLVAVSIATILTFSRTGAAGVALAGAVVALCVPGCARTIWPAYAPLLASAGVALLRIPGGSVDAGGVGTRSELWAAAWRMFRAHPLLGVGAGNYELRLAEYGVAGVRTHANNWYLQALAEGGAALFAVQCAFIASIACVLWRRIATAPLWTLAAFAATVVFIVHGAFDDLLFFQRVGSPFMIVVGFGIAAASVDARPQTV